MATALYKLLFKEFQERFLCDTITKNITPNEEIFKSFYNQWPEYIDPIILLIRFYRINKHHEKASQWIQKLDKKDIIGKIMDDRLCKNELVFEKIFDEHIYKKNMNKSIQYAIQYLNMKESCNIPFIYTNLYFFSHQLPGITEWLNFRNIDKTNETQFSSSSISFYPPENILCIRYVNYIYDELTGQAISKPENTFISKNIIYWLNSEYSTEADENFGDLISKGTTCLGLEDIRLIENPDGNCEFWATQQQWSGDGINRIVKGILIFDNIMACKPVFTNLQILEPPEENTCEKNWIPFYDNKKNLHIIYGFWPFQVGKLSPDNILKINYHQENLPEIFRYMRGSSCLVKYNAPNKYCCVTHLSLNPPEGRGLRQYFHFLVFFILKDEKLIITHFTEPFYFPDKSNLTHSIQYCIGFNIRPCGKKLIGQFWYSSMDNHSGFIECPMNFFENIKHSTFPQYQDS
jgi:hypothetical protein